jgi:hypothetical protein
MNIAQRRHEIIYYSEISQKGMNEIFMIGCPDKSGRAMRPIKYKLLFS